LVRGADGGDAGRLESLDDVSARLRAARRVDEPACHVVGGARLEAEEELLRVDRRAGRNVLRTGGERGDGNPEQQKRGDSPGTGETQNERLTSRDARDET